MTSYYDRNGLQNCKSHAKTEYWLENNYIFTNSKWMTNYFDLSTYTKTQALNYTMQARQQIKLSTAVTALTFFEVTQTFTSLFDNFFYDMSTAINFVTYNLEQAQVPEYINAISFSENGYIQISVS